MIKNLKEPLLKKWTALRFGKVSLFAFAVVAFLGGHFTMDSYMNTCRAQSLLQPPLPMVVPPTYGGTCFLAFGPPICNPVPCDMDTTSEDVVDTIWDAFHDTLVDYASSSPDYTATKRGGATEVSGTGLEGFADGIVDAMLFALMDRLNDIELGYIDWFETMWFYNLKPALMDMTDQQNTSNADQVRAFQGGQDTSDSNMVNVGHQEQQVKDARTFRLSEKRRLPRRRRRRRRPARLQPEPRGQEDPAKRHHHRRRPQREEHSRRQGTRRAQRRALRRLRKPVLQPDRQRRRFTMRRHPGARPCER